MRVEDALKDVLFRITGDDKGGSMGVIQPARFVVPSFETKDGMGNAHWEGEGDAGRRRFGRVV